MGADADQSVRAELDRMWGGPFPRLLDYVPGNLEFGTEETIYFESDGTGASKIEQIQKLIVASKSILVTGGSVHPGVCEIVLPTGARFHSASFWGDKEAWRKRFHFAAAAAGRGLARVVQSDFVIIGRDMAVPLDICTIYFDLTQDPASPRIVRWSVSGTIATT